jgi:hypothetical protein
MGFYELMNLVMCMADHGALVGYAAGLRVKKYLLDLETYDNIFYI